MDEIQAGHVLVGDFGVHAAHLGMIQRRDQREIRSGDGEIHVPARLVGLGFEGELVAVLLLRCEYSQRKLIASRKRLIASTGFLVASRFDALAAAPEDVDLRAELGAEVHRAHRLLDRVGADAARCCW